MSTSGAAGWAAFFVKLIITSVVAAIVLFGVTVFAMNRYMASVQTAITRLSSNVQTLNATVERVDGNLTASVERLNNNVSRIDREITSLQGKSSRLAQDLQRIEGTVDNPPPRQAEVADDASEPEETPATATATTEQASPSAITSNPVPRPNQALPIPASRPPQ